MYREVGIPNTVKKYYRFVAIQLAFKIPLVRCADTYAFCSVSLSMRALQSQGKPTHTPY